MVAIIRTDKAEEKYLGGLWRETPDGHKPRWNTAQPHEHWQGRHITLIITGDTSGNPQVTWLARASKTRGHADDLKRRIEVVAPYRLAKPIPWNSLIDAVPRRSQPYLARNGALPDGVGKHVVDALTRLASDAASHLNRLRTESGGIPVETRSDEILQQTRDATLSAVRMTGFDPDHITSWSLSEDSSRSFIERLQQRDGPSHEDDMITHDAQRFRDWLGPEDWLSRSAFTGFSEGEQRLVIYNANRKAAEETLGVDLIYFHETRNSFVLVQYKRMSRQGNSEWKFYPNGDGNLQDQLERMRAIDAECAKLSQGSDDYRLNAQPSWLKLCHADSILPDARTLTPGMYLTREHFDQIYTKANLPGQVRAFSRKTVERYFDNTEFTELVAGGWIGSSGYGSSGVQKQLEASLAGSREVVFAAVTGTPPSKSQRVRSLREGSTKKTS
ncbi:hypothetical protein [Streptomyces sp. NPDC001508]|uniref:hypothetical protein n=1 Tax=Streptomyces sp. NPDC001508 TaxID=3154656 RepID=UPI0033303210